MGAIEHWDKAGPSLLPITQSWTQLDREQGLTGAASTMATIRRLPARRDGLPAGHGQLEARHPQVGQYSKAQAANSISTTMEK